MKITRVESIVLFDQYQLAHLAAHIIYLSVLAYAEHDSFDANEASAVAQYCHLSLDSSSGAYVECSTHPLVAPCRPLMAPYLAPITAGCDGRVRSLLTG